MKGNGAHLYAEQENSMKCDDPSGQRNILQGLSKLSGIPQIWWECPHHLVIGTVKK